MFKALLLAAALLVMPSAVAAHDSPPAHYHVGSVQPFVGIMCRDRLSAMLIFNTWMESGQRAAAVEFQVLATMRTCRFFQPGYKALFIERIISSIAPDRNGDAVNVLVFKVSPEKGSDEINYLLTWENIGQGT